jgi:diguanylate cyclase (GGDEF)-like protein
VTGWESFPREIKLLAMGLSGARAATAEQVAVALRPELSVRWAVTSLAGDGWLVQAEDVTELGTLRQAVQLSDERLKTLSALHRLVEQVDFDVEVETAVQLIAERTRVLIDADLVAVGKIDGSDVVFPVIAGHADLAGIRVPIEASINGTCIRTGRTQVSDDTELDDRIHKPATRAVGARSLVVVPLRHSGEIPGVLDVLSARPAAFSANDVNTVELVGGAISAAYGHAADLATKRVLLGELRANVDALRQSEAKLRYVAQHDALTGLSNRINFLDRLASALSRPQQVAVLYIDVDYFKQVNDDLGHGAGDRLLREIAVRLRASVRPNDLPARFGGDEFTVLCEEINNREDLAAQAERIIRKVERRVNLEGVDVHPTLSIGATIGHGAADTPDAILKAADEALFEAKRQGRACYRIHEHA